MEICIYFYCLVGLPSVRSAISRRAAICTAVPFLRPLARASSSDANSSASPLSSEPLTPERYAPSWAFHRDSGLAHPSSSDKASRLPAGCGALAVSFVISGFMLSAYAESAGTLAMLGTGILGLAAVVRRKLNL